MALKTHPESHEFVACPTASGCWSLMQGQAISLLPREAGVLRIASGRVWATMDGPHTGFGNESGDHFLQAGQVLAVHGHAASARFRPRSSSGGSSVAPTAHGLGGLRRKLGRAAWGGFTRRHSQGTADFQIGFFSLAIAPVRFEEEGRLPV